MADWVNIIGAGFSKDYQALKCKHREMVSGTTNPAIKHKLRCPSVELKASLATWTIKNEVWIEAYMLTIITA